MLYACDLALADVSDIAQWTDGSPLALRSEDHLT